MQITAGKWKVPNLGNSSRYYGSPKYLILQVLCFSTGTQTSSGHGPLKMCPVWRSCFMAVLITNHFSVAEQDQKLLADIFLFVDRCGNVLAVYDLVGVNDPFLGSFPKAEERGCGPAFSAMSKICLFPVGGIPHLGHQYDLRMPVGLLCGDTEGQ